MKLITLLFLCCFYAAYSSAQSSLTDVYEAHTFPCDKESTTLEINICSGAKAEFADSLLNKLYRKILKSLDKDILKDKTILNGKKAGNKQADKDEVSFLLKNIDHNQRLKETIINSQRQWIKLRDANIEVERINCEGGTACVAMVNEAYIEETLDRIKKLESFYNE